MTIRTSVDGRTATITLDRPDKLNAFAGSMREDLLAALDTCEQDPSIGAVVITGAGRAFCAGGDVETMKELQRQADLPSFRRLLDAGAAVVDRICSMSKAVVAAVNGVAAGAGCNLALACDLRIASDQAKFSESFVRIGLHPDWGGTWLLPRLVGHSRAFELMASGRMVEAAEALAIGLVDRVVPAADLPAEAASLAASLAEAPPLAIAGIKRALAAAETNGLRQQLELEAEHQLSCFSSAEAAERMARFGTKRSS